MPVLDLLTSSGFGSLLGMRHALEPDHLAVIDPPTVEVITVRRQATDREMWWPIGSPPPVFAFECPVIHRRADGKVRVIAPAGMVKLVRADGWAGFPCRENWLRFKDASAVPAGSAGASVSPAPADAEVGRGNQPEQPR